MASEAKIRKLVEPYVDLPPKKKGVKYDGKVVHMRPVTDQVFAILTGGMLPEEAGMGIEEGRSTFHGKDGRFTRSRAAHTVTREGERFKMVRQLRRIGPRLAPEAPPEDVEPEAPTEEASEAARSLVGLLAASPGWTSMHNVTEAVFGEMVPSKKKRHRNWKEISDAERRGERRDPSSTTHKPDEWYDSDVYDDFETVGEV